MMTAISAFAARWSSRSLGSQPSLQFLVRLDSHRIVPQIWLSRADDALQDVAAEFAFGHRLDGVAGKFRREQGFELQFLNFSLKLLRTLFGAPFQIFDLFLHGGDGLVFLHHLELQFIFGFLLGFLSARWPSRLGRASRWSVPARAWRRPVHAACDQLGLRLLRFGEL